MSGPSNIHLLFPLPGCLKAEEEERDVCCGPYSAPSLDFFIFLLLSKEKEER
jgi:hypothetical protein